MSPSGNMIALFNNDAKSCVWVITNSFFATVLNTVI